MVIDTPMNTGTKIDMNERHKGRELKIALH